MDKNFDPKKNIAGETGYDSPTNLGTTSASSELSNLSLDPEDVVKRVDGIVEDLGLDELAVDANYAPGIKTEAVPVTPEIRKPKKDVFVRTRPSEEWHSVYVIEDKEYKTKGYHIIAPQLMKNEFVRENCGVTVMHMAPSIDRSGRVFVWPLRLPNTERSDLWADSALEAAELASKNWVRVGANMDLGCYDTLKALGDLEEPDWGGESASSILGRTFKGRVISSMKHPLIMRLQGLE